MTKIQFSPSVLQSYATFERYLSSEEVIDKICDEAEKPYVLGEGKLGSFQVARVSTTFCFRFCYSIIVEAAATFLYYSYMVSRETALDLHVEARRQAAYTVMVLQNYLPFPFGKGENVLVDCLNVPSFDAHEVYAHGRINLEQIPISPEVLDHIHPEYVKRTSIILDDLDGQCAGICDWMAYLYFKTKDHFYNPEHHLVSVVKQISNGAGRQATLWQIMQIDHPPILGLKKRCVAQLENSPRTKKIQEVFETLRPGLYSIGTAVHRMNLAITEKQSFYFLDPNSGLTKTTPEKMGKELFGNSILKICQISI